MTAASWPGSAERAQRLAPGFFQIIVDFQVTSDVPVARQVVGDAGVNSPPAMMAEHVAALVQQRLGAHLRRPGPRIGVDCVEVDEQPVLVVHRERAPTGSLGSTGRKLNSVVAMYGMASRAWVRHNANTSKCSPVGLRISLPACALVLSTCAATLLHPRAVGAAIRPRRA